MAAQLYTLPAKILWGAVLQQGGDRLLIIFVLVPAHQHWICSKRWVLLDQLCNQLTVLGAAFILPLECPEDSIVDQQYLCAAGIIFNTLEKDLPYVSMARRGSAPAPAQCQAGGRRSPGQCRPDPGRQ